MTLESRRFQMCTVILTSTMDPDIWFDENDVGSHALNLRRSLESIVTAADSGQRLGELEQLFDRIKESGKSKRYDCVVGVSGGVHSTFLILQAVEHGLRLLAVHFDSGRNPELAVDIISNIIKKLDLDLFTEVVDRREMRDLELSLFKASVPNCDIPHRSCFLLGCLPAS